MNKEQAKKVIQKVLDKHFKSDEEYISLNNTEFLQALDITMESLDENERLKKERDYILEKAKAELKDNEWVDVRDRLPSESGTYLVSLNGVWKKDYCKFWFFGKGENGEMGWDEFEGYENIIAWRPLPQPYERKE